MPDQDESKDLSLDKEFQARKKTLLAWKSLSTMQPFVIMHLLKNGTLVGITDHETMLAIKDLKTPLGIMPEAKIRKSDVEYLEFSMV